MTGSFKIAVNAKNMGRYLRLKVGPRGGVIIESSSNKRFRCGTTKTHRLPKQNLQLIRARYAAPTSDEAAA